MLHISYTVTAAQKGPGIVIAYPGQDVELLCTVTRTSTSQTVTRTSTSQTTGWLVNNMGPYRINAIRNGILIGHTGTWDNSNLIVENIMMNDGRNDSEYSCVVIPAGGFVTFGDIIDESDPFFLYIPGTYVHTYVC